MDLSKVLKIDKNNYYKLYLNEIVTQLKIKLQVSFNSRLLILFLTVHENWKPF